MYSAFVGVSAPGQDGMRHALVPISNAASKGFFRLRVLRAPGSTVVPSRFSPADLAGIHNFASSRSRWAVDVGIAPAISKPGVFARRHLQASQAAMSPAKTGGR